MSKEGEVHVDLSPEQWAHVKAALEGQIATSVTYAGDLERALEVEQWKVAWFLAGYSGLGRQYKEMKAQLVAVREAWEFVEIAWTDSDVHPRHAPDECDSCDALWAMLMVIRDRILSKEGNE